MIEERLVNIEAKITFQEDLIEELNKTVYQQQKSWSGLKRFVKRSQDTSNHRLKRETRECLRTKGRRIISVQRRCLKVVVIDSLGCE